MWSMDELIGEKDGLIGIISSYSAESEFNLFKEYIKNKFIIDGGLIYISSSDVKKKCLKFLDELDISLKKLIDINRLSIISREDYLDKDGINVEALIARIEREINRISEIAIDKKPSVYISVDSFWNSIGLYGIKNIYRRLREIHDTGKANFVIRYIVGDIDKTYALPILYYHDYLVIDGVDTFQVYTPDELIYKGLSTLSERRSAEFRCTKAMMRSEYLEHMTQIIGGIIHDINNLLVSILGHAQYSLHIDDIDEIKKGLEIISKLALDGSSITKRIKGNFKDSIESPKDIYRFNYIVQNSIDMIKHKFKSLNSYGSGKLELNVSLNSKHYIYANEYDLRHSIINIIQNGIEAMEEVGLMTIRTYDEEDNIVLEICDTGCGIERHIMDKVFMPYFTTKGSKGTGLGLCLAKKIFEECGGKISIESEVGNGTKFTIYFPAMKFSEAVAEENNEMYNVV